ncbi:MAG: hypothetical protein ACKVYV_00755 [Limisphaerales bacterium]
MPDSSSRSAAWRSLAALVGVLVVVLAWLFRDNFNPALCLFANDGPLGLAKAAQYRDLLNPRSLLQTWADLNWVGMYGGTSPLPFTTSLFLLLDPRNFISFAPPLISLFLGVCAWLFFRALRFHPAVCALGGLAAALNGDFFSYAAWGLSSLPACVAAVFLALAAIAAPWRHGWLRWPLAGVALGCALMEGFDNGAIFSLYVAAFAVAWMWFGRRNEAPARALLGGGAGVAVIAAVSAATAAHILLMLVTTQIQGVAVAQRDTGDSRANWNFATQWSLPPAESIRAVIPGLYGYRMDTPGGGQYRGAVGRDPAWDAYFAQPNPDPSRPPAGFLRYSGAGHFAGVFVVLVALWAAVQGCRKNGPFTAEERRWVHFWLVAAGLSLLFAWGRHAPFYHLIYALPYFNTIRNPVKFLHPFNVALVILFGYGLQALWRTAVEGRAARAGGLVAAVKAWWAAAARADRRWAAGLLIALGLAALAWLIHASGRGALVQQLGREGFAPAEAMEIAGFANRELGLFVLVLAVSVVLFLALASGLLAGARARWAAIAVGTLVALDLARANVPWIIHYDWKEKYATNALLDALRMEPWTGRVTGQLPFALPGEAGQAQAMLGNVYGVEWLQHQFRFFDIQALDIVVLARTPQEIEDYRGALRANPLREWELTNTRWLITLAGMVEAMNTQLDPVRKPFRLALPFELGQDRAGGPIMLRTNAAGPFALVEYMAALPRVKLFHQWRAGVPDADVLRLLADTNFNAHAEVLVADSVAAPAGGTNAAGSVAVKHYDPRRWAVTVETSAPAVLLLNDDFDPKWKVRVDGVGQPLLRCNFLMRGVAVPAGRHEVEFTFEPENTSLWLTFAALGGGMTLLAFGVAGLRPRGPAGS